MGWIDQCNKGEATILLQYVYNLGVSLSQFGSAVLGGDPDESLSGRTGKASRAGKWWHVHVQEPAINRLFKDPKHCFNAIEDDEGAKELWDWSK